MSKRSREDSISSSAIDASPNTHLSSRPPSVEAAVHTPKYASLDTTEPTASTMRCFLPPHQTLTFSTYDEYESHYQQAHANRCTDCKKNLPSSHFLDLHIAENHDPIVASKRDKGEKTYACFVEDCDKVCSDWKKRRSHLVDKHGFPRNYDFFIVNNGIDGRRSMLRAGIDARGHRKSSRERSNSSATEAASSQSTEATSVGEPEAGHAESEPMTVRAKERDVTGQLPARQGAGVDELTTSMSSLKMVPRSITFGRRGGRAGFSKS